MFWKKELRVPQCEKEVKWYSNRIKIDSSLNYSLKIKAHRVGSDKIYEIKYSQGEF